MQTEHRFPEVFSRVITTAVLCGGLVWALLLLRGVFVIREAAIGVHYIVRFGPVTLHDIAKLPLVDGFVMQLDFSWGLLPFSLFWIMIGMICTVLLKRYRKTTFRSNTEYTKGHDRRTKTT